MTEIKTASYGSWKSPITSDLIVKESIGLSQVKLDGDDIYWIEMRPSEGGRQVIVRHTRDGQSLDVTPREFNARTRVHEYGGGDYAVQGGLVYIQDPNRLPGTADRMSALPTRFCAMPTRSSTRSATV